MTTLELRGFVEEENKVVYLKLSPEDAKRAENGNNTTMDVDGVYGECRCCSTKGHHRDLFKEYYFGGIRNVYSEIFEECLNFNFSQHPQLTTLICMECVIRLQEANNFKLLAMNTERRLLECLATRAEDGITIDAVTQSNSLDLKHEPDVKVECWPLEFNYDEYLDDQNPDLNAEDTNEDCRISDEDTSDDDTPLHVSSSLDVADKTIIPVKSKKKYEKAYQDFMSWKSTKNYTSVNENIVLAYFEELVKKLQSSSLWALYSMLKCMLIIHHNVNMSKYTRVLALLKRKAQEYTGKKSKTFSSDEINKFLNEAPDDKYLSTKVILILGIMGGCRRHELYSILYSDVEILGPTILVKVNNVESKSTRTFSITGRHYELCRKYMALRPKNCANPGFFIGYRSGKCIPQRIGINTFGSTGKIVASYLNLPNPKLYTGQCFRRTNAALLDKTGGDLTSLIRLSLEMETADGVRAQNSSQSDILDGSRNCLLEQSTERSWNEGTDLLDNSAEEPQFSEQSCANDYITSSHYSTASNGVDQLSIQSKSKIKYEKVYNAFMEWRASKNLTSFSEEVILAYFEELAQKSKASSLWSIFSMLKSTLSIHRNVDMSKHLKVTALIKRRAKDETAKIYNTFSTDEIKKFLDEAPDHIYLSKKVMLIFGVIGACRCLELYNIQFADVQTFGTETILVKINDSECRTTRTFSVTGKYCDPCFKYMALRPENSNISAFFVAYRHGKCVSQRIGKNMFGNVGRVIANYLHLPNPELYVGQCFRRTAATMSISVDGDFISLKKRHSRLKSRKKCAKRFSEGRNCVENTSGDNVKDIQNDVNIEIKVEPWSSEHAGDDCSDDQCDDVKTSEDTQKKSNIAIDMKDDPDIDIEDSWLLTQSYGNCSDTLGSHSNATEDTNDHSKESDTDTSVDETPLISTTNTDNQLPQKSKKRYEKTYNDFMEWRASRSHTSFSEDIVYDYFEELSKKVQSPTLWVVYSILKCTLSLHHRVELSKYTRVIKMLKSKAAGHKTKKSKTFSPDEVKRFLDEAPDKAYLAKKIILIFGIMGGCRTQELYNILYTDVEIFGSTILVKVNNADTKTTRTFSITGRYSDLCKKYISLRPEPCNNLGFFLDYRSGKCTSQRVGKNAFGNVGKTIAVFLQLPNPELFTGHCFRKTSEAVLVGDDGNITDSKRYGRTKSR